MQDRVLDTADILVDRQPGADSLCVGWHPGPWRAEPREVPGRVDERVHGVGFAHGWRTAFGTGDMLPGRVAVERVTGHVEAHILGQLHRQVRRRYRHDAASLAMDHGDGTAPIALARDAPVAQAELGLAHALRLAAHGPRGEPVRH